MPSSAHVIAASPGSSPASDYPFPKPSRVSPFRAVRLRSIKAPIPASNRARAAAVVGELAGTDAGGGSWNLAANPSLPPLHVGRAADARGKLLEAVEPTSNGTSAV